MMKSKAIPDACVYLRSPAAGSLQDLRLQKENTAESAGRAEPSADACHTHPDCGKPWVAASRLKRVHTHKQTHRRLYLVFTIY